MKKAKGRGIVITFILLMLAFGTTLEAQRHRHRPPPYRVAEPAAVVLVGAGLTSLAIYIKKKRSK